jgi:ketosteroid isomerase-like protein
MKILLAIMIISFCCIGCTQEPDREAELAELLETDRRFSELSVEKGTLEAFDTFMADDAILYRDGAHPFRGRAAIREAIAGNGTLRWEPFFADISESADLGYTLGEYAYTTADSLGVPSTSTGYYISVWKLQPDGSWKFVFDSGIRSPLPEDDGPE